MEQETQPRRKKLEQTTEYATINHGADNRVNNRIRNEKNKEQTDEYTNNSDKKHK